MQRSYRLLAALSPLAFATAGCGIIIGIDDFKDAPSTTTGGSGGTGTTSSGGTATTGGGGSGGDSTTGGGGTGGSTTTGGGGTGGETGTLCTPGMDYDCYDGTPGTEGIGPCKGGKKKCSDGGDAFGPCIGQVIDMSIEICSTPADDNCNNLSNLQEGCCIPNQPTSCYTGPAGTEDVGQCKHGTVNCNADGTFPAQCPNQVLPVEEFCATPADEDCNGKNCWVWSLGKGGFGNDYASAVSSDGFTNKVYTAGAFNGDFEIGGGFLQYTGGSFDNVFLAQYNADGSNGWGKKFGKNGTGVAVSALSADNLLGVTIGGYYLFGDIDFGTGSLAWNANFDGYVARFGTDGTPLFSRRFAGSGHDQVNAVKAVTDGIVVAGDYDSPTLQVGDVADTPLTNQGMGDVFVAKYDRNTDALLWKLNIGGAGAEGGGGQCMDGDFVSGDAYVVGVTSTTGLQIGGLPAIPAGSNMFFTRISAVGTPVWAKGFSIPGFGLLVASSPQGPYLVASATQGIDLGGGLMAHADQNDIYIAHYDTSGNLLWQKPFAQLGNQTVVAVAADSSGLVLSASYDMAFTLGPKMLDPAGQPGSGAFVVKLDIDGNIVWVHQLGAPPYVALDVPHFTVMAGGFSGTADFGGGSISATASTLDVFIGKLGK